MSAIHRFCACRRAPAGLTLLELVVVMAILAGLAGLLVPVMGNVLNQGRYANGATNSGELAKLLETYRAANGVYPIDMDSLLVSGGTGSAPTGLYTVANNSTTNVGVWNGPPMAGSGLYTMGTPFTSHSGYWMSFSQAFGVQNGSSLQYEVMDHDTSATDVSSSATQARTVTGATADQLAMVDTTDTNFVKALGFSTGTVTSGVQLVAMGVGPRCSAVTRYAANTPLGTGQNAQYYGRFIAIFALYSGNGNPPARLVKVLDPLGNTSDADISSFKTAASQ
jgi:prepilin-type N-terminal cleavage/methylation domain-containing protein